jgi:hypothetical protein
MKKINKILLELYSDRKQILFLSFLGYISYLIEGLIPSNPNVIQASGLVVGITGGALALTGMIMGGAKAKKAQEAADKNAKMANDMAEKQLAFQKVQQKKLDKQKDVYKAMEFKNPYENMENAFAENVYEDLTVNQQQAQFQAQQGAQQRSNIMQGLKGAAGGSGIAGLAQAMAGQGQLAAQQASASIGQQESRNLQLKAQGAQQKQRGAAAADLQERQGEGAVQDMERSRQSTLLGISMGESAGANAAAMQAQQNQLSAGAAQANIEGQSAAAMYGMAGQGIGMIGSGIAAGQKPTV